MQILKRGSHSSWNFECFIHFVFPNCPVCQLLLLKQLSKVVLRKKDRFDYWGLLIKVVLRKYARLRYFCDPVFLTFEKLEKLNCQYAKQLAIFMVKLIGIHVVF